MAIHAVSTASELTAALGNAVGGDEIVCASGSYGSHSITGRTFAPSLRISGDGAVLVGLTVVGSSGLRCDGLVFHDPAIHSQEDYLVRADNSGALEFFGCIFQGSVDGIYTDNISGVYGIDVAGIGIVGCLFEHVGRGMTLHRCDDVEVAGNEFADLRTTPIQATTLNQAKFNFNRFEGPNLGPGDHSDSIHIWANSGSPCSHNVEIIGNVLLQGTGSPEPAVFIQNDRVLPLGEYHTNFVIEGNLNYHGHVNSFLLFGIDGGRITNNTFLSIGGSGFLYNPEMKIGSVRNAEIARNVGNNVVPADPAQNVNSYDNSGVQTWGPTLQNYYGNIFVNPFSNENAVIADFAPLPGKLTTPSGDTVGAVDHDGAMLFTQAQDTPSMPLPPFDPTAYTADPDAIQMFADYDAIVRPFVDNLEVQVAALSDQSAAVAALDGRATVLESKMTAVGVAATG